MIIIDEGGDVFWVDIHTTLSCIIKPCIINLYIIMCDICVRGAHDIAV